ncbi:MAG: aminotransferase [Ignavibacteria bacterium CG_4_8_14_3_um_filter_37_9]|nr:DegT/DnrJ/EryC1/StrS family aminotransferase [Ignavibacteria bacterium]OIO23712.1 MAG: aminotransferase [Ignavibacteria bacterium CG1_02_37_35]PIS45345.1 MAG: aminotransferase [Ignavibacteria bacterium CG08_land_8_20_14_0_20_37_9]PIW98248.1 MAG: aminotransferase [Ignavibacteria bacterium CG_4_8_14_3_um_filter_37_9]PIX93706.1 MAG: aminotransferase [Ignavibacteria bacterium CG_4_10_14_3_um_filter_37_18]PJC58212.1 MAG: aminotransferase [Ignavibacteria bacterium CG_4_9_14_0_2_um_filter_37_13]
MIEYENLGELNKSFFEEYKISFEKTLNSGWYILGKNVKQFEEEFAAYHQTKYCIGVGSGLDALILSLKTFNFERDSEVIVPSNTYIATILSILHCGLKPVLVEPDLKTYNIDPQKIEEKISSKTKAIMIVHLYGKSCDMSPILALKEKYHLALIEDCAQSHGAKYFGKLTGTFGEFGAFSFYPTKNLGALGDAGAVLTPDFAFTQSIKRLRNYGSDVKYYNEIVGYNSRLQEVQAGFLSIKLRHLDEINAHKQKLAKIYFENLKDDFTKPVDDKNYFDVFHIFNIRHTKRDKLKEYLLKNGIKTEIHYPVPPHKQKAMEGIIIEKDFPISEEIHATTLSLPISFYHTEDDIYRVIEAMNKF